jgi:type 1 glutamine amidotransferase
MGNFSRIKKNVHVIVLVILFGLTANAQPAAFKALVIASTDPYHARMVEAAKPFFEKLAAENNFRADFTKDTSRLSDSSLADYKVVIQLQLAPFNMSSSQQAALQKFIEKGRGWVGIHAAGLTGKNFLAPGVIYWQWFQDFMGGSVYSPHPAFQKGTIIMEDRTHPATKNMPASFEISDEWYEFDKSPRPNVRVLARADESTYKQNKPMGDHPMIWTNEKFDRMIYICIGHDESLLTNDSYVTLVRDAVLWAASPVSR